MKAYLKKLPGGALVPDTAESEEAVRSLKTGQVIAVEWHHPRNYKFLRKFFQMCTVGFEAWEPPLVEHKGLPMEKNFDRFREDVIVAAGYYDIVFNLKGELRKRAKSIAFGNMTEEEFGKLYNAVADVLLKYVLHNYTRQDLDDVVEELLGFTTN